MKIFVGCYCGYLKYEAFGKIDSFNQCHYRQSPHIMGDYQNVLVFMPLDGFCYWEQNQNILKELILIYQWNDFFV